MNLGPFKKWRDLYLGLPWDRRAVWTALTLALIPITLASWRGRSPEITGESGEVAVSVDTHIPRGFVLIPIEVSNYESLDSILGRFGWVDLFQAAGEQGSTQRLVARDVRILRAPQNPTHFAILIPERQASRVLRTGGAFTVVVKRPGARGTEFVESPHVTPASGRRITYEGN